MWSGVFWQRMRDSICIFRFAENKGSAPSSRRGQQSTGLLHLDRFESPTYHNIKTPTTDVVGVLMAEDEGFEFRGVSTFFNQS